MLLVLAMMGQQEKQQEMWVEPVNLGRVIPEDAPLRQINRELRLDFVREEVARFYGRNGNESVDPVVIVKLMLLLFLDDVASPLLTSIQEKHPTKQRPPQTSYEAVASHRVSPYRPQGGRRNLYPRCHRFLQTTHHVHHRRPRRYRG